MSKPTVNKRRGRIALRAAIAAVAFLFFFTSSASLAFSGAGEMGSGKLEAFEPVLNKPFELSALYDSGEGKSTSKRSDIFAGSIPRMNDAQAAALIEASSGQMLLAKNPELHLPMASTTKTMTALIALERCSPDEVVTVAKEAAGVEGSSLYINAGEKLTVRDLLYGLMLRSGNDAAVALAVHIAGSVEGFAEIMNERARQLGLQNTNFVSPNGLDRDGHYSSAYDMCVIGAKALENPEFREIVSTQYHTIETDQRRIYVKNKNALLWDYEGCIGIKTGYTSKAGRCLLFAAEKNGLLLVGCVLNCRPMFEAAPEMLDFGFENYSLVKAVSAGTELSRCVVANGEKSVLALVAKDDIVILLKNGSELNAEVDISLNQAPVAPIMEGEVMGECELLIGGCTVGKTELLAKTDIAERSYRFYIKYLFGLFSRV